MIEQPQTSVAACIELLDGADIPVLRRTARELAALRRQEEQVGGRQIAAVVLQDPLMTLKLLAYCESQRRHSQPGSITTVDRAVMMLGISPFFRAFERLAVVEETLQAHPKSLLRLLRLLSRARRAAHLARDWASLRHDPEAEDIALAAMLHDGAEIVLLCFAPELALRLAQGPGQDGDASVPEAGVEHLGVALPELQQALCRRWRLPQLLQTAASEGGNTGARVRNVELAARAARDMTDGAGAAVLAEDFKAAGVLLHMAPEALMARAGIDAYAASDLAQPQ